LSIQCAIVVVDSGRAAAAAVDPGHRGMFPPEFLLSA
jgi:hypothetical protein